MEPPFGLKEVVVMRPGPRAQSASGPATFEFPILQSHIDDAMKGVLCHGEAFAAAWLDTTHGWPRYWVSRARWGGWKYEQASERAPSVRYCAILTLPIS